MRVEYSVLDNLVQEIQSDEAEFDVNKMINDTNDMICQMNEMVVIHDMGINVFNNSKGDKVKYTDIASPICDKIGVIISYIKQHNSIADNVRLIHKLEVKYAVLKHTISFSML